MLLDFDFAQKQSIFNIEIASVDGNSVLFRIIKDDKYAVNALLFCPVSCAQYQQHCFFIGQYLE